MGLDVQAEVAPANVFQEINTVVETADGKSALPADELACPVVDISSLRSGSKASEQEQRERLKQIVAAIDDNGFVAVTNHGVDQSVIETIHAESESFFANKLEEKLKAVAEDDALCGYREIAQDNLSRNMGRSHGPMDQRERLCMRGPDKDNHFPNARLGAAFTAWYEQARALEQDLYRIFARALALATGLPLEEDHFLTRIGSHQGLGLVNHYPKGTDVPCKLAGHADFSTFTILHAPTEGLEICRNEQWYRVVPRDDVLYVNIGILLQQWTNDRWKATLHRVRVVDEDMPDSGRTSIGYFSLQDPNLDDPSTMTPIVLRGDVARYSVVPIASFCDSLLSTYNKSPSTLKVQADRYTQEEKEKNQHAS